MRRSRAHVPLAAAGLGVALLAVACRGSSQSNDAALARFGDQALTVRDFEERLASQPPQIREQYATPEAREKLLADMVRLEILAQEARRRGLDRSPRLKVRVDELLVEEMMNGLFGSEEAQAKKITDDEIRRYYDAHPAEFTGARPGMARSLEEAQPLIRGRLAQEKRREAAAKFTDDLVARAHVQIHRERLP